jgi:hypothetical protein
MFKSLFAIFVVVGAFMLLGVAAPASAAGLDGTWTASDAQGNLTRVIIATDAAGNSTLRGFGRCSPECDWGTAPLTTYGKSVSDAVPAAGTASYTTGFSVTTLTVQLSKPGVLQVGVFTHFTDNSGRKNYVAYQALRQPIPPGTISHAQMTTSEHSSAAVFMKNQTPPPMIAGANATASPPSGAGKRVILSDGTVEVTYADGTQKIYSKSGVTTITPDGKKTYHAYSHMELSAQPPTPPSVPDSQTSKWADQEASQLLSLITALVGNDQSSVDNLLSNESHMTWYQKIDYRTSVVQTLATP